MGHSIGEVAVSQRVPLAATKHKKIKPRMTRMAADKDETKKDRKMGDRKIID